MTEASMPAYVERGGELVYRVPYAARDAVQYVFVLPADPVRLGATLARDFGTPTAGLVDVRPAVSAVILGVSRIPAIKSAAPPDSELGAGISELEVAFMVMGVDVRRNRPVVCVPYLFVDSGMAVAAGRELFGLPKQLGVVAIEGDPAPTHVSVDALSIERFDPTVPFRPHRVVEITPVGGSSAGQRWATLVDAIWGLARAFASAARLGHEPPRPGPGGLGGLLSEAGHALDRLVGDARILGASVEAFATGRFPVIGLKQFRDVERSDRACYQAIAEATMHITRFGGGGLLGDYSVSLGDLQSEPIRQDLGLPDGPIRPLLSGWLRYDFTLETGHELWNAVRPGTP
jgi:hypothetical protein